MRTPTFAILALLLFGLLLTLIFRGAAPVNPVAVAPVSTQVAPDKAPAAKSAATTTLNFCSDLWPPYSEEAGSDREGYVVELIRAIYEPLGYQVNYTVQPWGRCLAGVRSGRFSGLAGAEHGDVPDMVFPRLMAGGSLPTFYTMGGKSWTYRGEESLRSLRLGVVQNYTYAPALDRYIEAAQQSDRVVVFRGDEPLKQMLVGLQAGRIDILIENSVVVATFLRQKKLPADLLRVAGIAGPAKGVFVPFSPVDERAHELAALFDRGILGLRQDGGLQRILTRYGVTDWHNQVTGRGY